MGLNIAELPAEEWAWPSSGVEKKEASMQEKWMDNKVTKVKKRV